MPSIVLSGGFLMLPHRSVDVHQFSMVPRAEIPRSAFRMQKVLKTTFDAGYLIPVMCEEVLPGDTFNVHMTTLARLATPLFPFMDNLVLDSFFFFIPNRLVWTNWAKFMGEQDNPGDSTSYTIPVIGTPPSGHAVGSIFDHFGLPTAGQFSAAGVLSVSCLPLRGYNLVYDQWFRDQNLQARPVINKGDGSDSIISYDLLRRGKRHDYFTSCLPWTQKGTPVQLPLGSSAPVVSDGTVTLFNNSTFNRPSNLNFTSGATTVSWSNSTAQAGSSTFGPAGATGTGLRADLSTATAATINQIRQAFQIQKLLERDARGGTRLTEIVLAHFGVRSLDARLQRSEYLGGGSAHIAINEVTQTSATGVTGGTTPVGTLAAQGRSVGRHGFVQSFTEHGYILGLVCVRADLTYQQGVRRHWSRSTRYDFYWPAFAMLGEQAVLNKEIFCDGSATDSQVFGYQERWSEYRQAPSEIHGLFRSTAAGTIDAWHLAQRFTGVPTLNATFIQETPPLSRVLAVGAAANGAQFLMDAFFDMKVARALPTYSVPGLVDHF